MILPNADFTFMVLMGLSQFAFLAGKTQNLILEIASIMSKKDKGWKIGELIIIFGSNFGDKKDISSFNDFAIYERPWTSNVIWSPTGDRIDLKIPDTLPPDDDYKVRVSHGGYISYPYPYKIVPKETQYTNEKIASLHFVKYSVLTYGKVLLQFAIISVTEA